MERYRYSPLAGNDFIRVSTIHPGEFHDDIVISLTEVAFTTSAPPKYEAVSYAWGSAEELQQVQVCAQAHLESPRQHSLDMVNCQKCRSCRSSTLECQNIHKHRHGTMFVNQNLAVALRHLRNSETSRVMWIDALCIDQDKDVEKGPQVAKMGEIFRLAARVVVWLGPKQNHSDQAMKLFSYFGSQIEIDWLNYNMRPSETCVDSTIADRYKPLRMYSGECSSMYHLLCRPWYYRLWVRQEIYLANSEAVIMCGLWVVKWETFRRGLAVIYFKPPNNDEPSKSILNSLRSLQGFIHQRTDMSLLDLRNCFQDSECRDPRDRIYGVLSLLKENHRVLCGKPDYTRPWTELYQEVVRCFVREETTLRLLQECQLREDRSCPSWVPDWSTRSNNSQLSLLGYSLFASAQIGRCHVISEAGAMNVMGISKAVINDIQQIPDLWDLTGDKVLGVLFELLPKHQLNASLLESYARTFICNQHRESYVPNDQRRPYFDDARQIVLDMMSKKEYNLDSFSPENSVGKFLSTARKFMSNRIFFRTTSGYIGNAPAQAAIGDEVCVILGCDAPMLLRPCRNGRFLVVGDCFVDGLCQGEAILGPLPSNIQMVLVHVKRSDFAPGILDVASGEVSFEDPRLEFLPVDLDNFRNNLVGNPHERLELDPIVLRECGVDLKCFCLI
ncbi:HET-domain-containing protein [Whalleya microplaca]|nr:HET-domain-containing protein [Whalleya microplaca]